MMNLLKKLFAGNNEPEENVRHKNEERNFDILKYDGIRAQRIGKWIYAEKCFKEALNIRPDLETASLLVSTSLQLNKLEQAHEVLGQMISLEPQRLQSYLDLARVCYLQEHYDDMLVTAQQAAQLVPDNETPYFLQAQAYHKLGDSIHTIVALTQAISRKEDFTEAYLMRGQVLLEMKQYNEALEDVDFLLKHDSIDEEALRLAAEVQQGLGNEDEAVTYYRKVIDLNPFNEHSYEQIALIHARKKDYAQAIAYLRKEAVALPDGTPRGHVVMRYNGVPLGFEKNIGNRANNLYPAEWKIKSTHTPEGNNEVITKRTSDKQTRIQ